MTKTLTAVVLSAKPITRGVKNAVELNYVSTIRTPTELHAARLTALGDVSTANWFYLDDTDPLPVGLSETKGVLYGDFITQRPDQVYPDVFKAEPWTAAGHKANIGLIHKAVVNTEVSSKVVPYLPRGEYWTEFLLYYFVAALGGATYDPKLRMPWAVSAAGWHKHAAVPARNSLMWVMQNGRDALRKMEKHK